MIDFDTLVDDLDSVQQDAFATAVMINGVETKGIFDEGSNEFESIDTMDRTLEIPVSDLPSGIEAGITKLTLIADGREFTINKVLQEGKLNILVLYD